MSTRECPSCAMDVDKQATICPVCGYEFPRQNKSVIIMAWVMIILAVLWLVL